MSVPPANAIAFSWFSDNKVDTGYTVPTTNAQKNCGNPSDIKEAVATIGFSPDQAGAMKILCGLMEYTPSGSSQPCSQDPAVFGTYSLVVPPTVEQMDILGYRLYSAFFGTNNVPALRDEHKYVGYLAGFLNSPCNAKDLGVFNPQDVNMVTKASQQGYAKIDIANLGKVETHLYEYVFSGDAMLWIQERAPFTIYKEPCYNLPKLLGATAQAFAVQNPNASAAAMTLSATSTAATGGKTGESTCQIDNLGWIICPVMNFMAKIMDRAFEFISKSFLSTDPSLVKDTYEAWAVFRNYANVAFVLVFLVIIYSQVSSVGISNYGIKRMLPKLIIAAILVNASFFLCQAAVDVSNILGYGLNQTMTSAIGSIGTSSTQQTGSVWGVLVGSILILGTGIALMYCIPLLLVSLLAALTIVITLVVRKAAIVILIVLSPLAFVAYLLPNTENLFKKWWKMFSSMLMIFPIISLLFGGGKLASAVINKTAGNDMVLQLTAAAVSVLPLIFAYKVLKDSLAAIPVLGAKMSALNNKSSAKVGAATKKRWNDSTLARGIAQRKAGKDQYKQKKFARNLGKGGLTGFVARGGLAVTPAGKFAKQNAQASASAAVREQELKEINAAAADMSEAAVKDPRIGQPMPGGGTYSQSDIIATQLREAIRQGNTTKAQAAIRALKQQGEGGVAKLQSTLADSVKGGEMKADMSSSLRSYIGSQHSDIKESDARITNWVGTGVSNSLTDTDFSGLTDKQVASQTESAIKHAVTTGQLDTTRSARIKKAADEGNIDLKENKRNAMP
ncbi:MAG: hypothetical protein WAQ25_00520 [Candidatus Saccharimonas sp.]